MPASRMGRKCTSTGTTSRTATPRSCSRPRWRRARSKRRARPRSKSSIARTATGRWQMPQHKLAIVTGASSGIGLEIAKLAAEDGYDLIVAADTPFVEAGPALKDSGVNVEEVEADLATKQGVDQLLAKVGDRQVDVLV